MIKIGEKKGDFQIRAEIGKGGMGTIYYATDIMLNRDIALKVIHPQLTNNPQLLERFKIEAMTQAKMSHPNIVTIFSFSKIDNDNIIAMEYVEGKNLKDLLLEKRILPIEESLSILKQILKALVYSHSRNVIHRDIKPANILIKEDGTVKLSDFGIAKVFGKQGLTKTGMLLGTPWYTPPEQILGENIDFRSDLYSVGITFYEMVTGTVPFDSETNSDFQIQKAHLETPPPRPSIFNPEIGSRIEKFILKALQKKPEKRFQSAADMLKAIEQLEKKVAETTMIRREKTAIVDSGIGIKKSGKKKNLLITLFILLAVTGIALSYIFIIKPESKKTIPEQTEIRDKSVIPAKEPDEDTENNMNIIRGNEENVKKLSQNDNAVQKKGSKNDLTEREKMKGNQSGSKGGNKKPETGPARKIIKKSSTIKTGSAKNPDTTKSDLNQNKGNMKDDISKNNTSEKNSITQPDINVEAELVKLGSDLDKGDMKSAEVRVNELMKKNIKVAKLYSYAGKLKFIRKDFSTAESLWKKALNLGGSVYFRFFHKHGIFNKGCSGELIIKKGLLVFDSLTKPSHSLALTTDRIKKIQKRVRSFGIQISYLSGKKTKKSVLILKGRNRRGEKFITEFLNKYILEDK